jgi:uncharacterized protein (TIGR02300 family)
MHRQGARPAMPSGSPAKPLRRFPITTTCQGTKAMRGTKRVCQGCEVRFYDLSRDPIVCPSCGAHYVPAAQMPEAGARATAFTNKTRWHSRGTKRADPAPDLAPEAAAADDATEVSGEALSPVPSDDVMLDEETDEADVSALVDHGVAKPEER